MARHCVSGLEIVGENRYLCGYVVVSSKGGVDIVVKVFATFVPKLALFGVILVFCEGVKGWFVAKIQRINHPSTMLRA